MRKNQYLLHVAIAFAFIFSTGLFDVSAQDVDQEQKDAPRKAKIKILQKEAGEYLVLDTTLTLAAGVSVEETIKSLKLDGAMLKSLGAKKVPVTSLGPPSAIESIQVLKMAKGDSAKSKIITMVMADSIKPTIYHRLAGDSANRFFKNHIVVRGTGSIDSTVYLSKHAAFVYKNSKKVDSLLKGKVIYTRDTVFSLRADSIFRRNVSIERLVDTDEVRILNIRKEGDTTMVRISGLETFNLNINPRNEVIILRSVKPVEPILKKKSKKEVKQEAASISDLQVQVYPNPTSGTTKIAFQVEKSSDVKVRIVNNQGTAVFQDQKERFRGQYTRDINLAKFGNGVYVVQVQVGKTVKSEKIMVQ